ncbi:hypothetical protein ACIHAR_35515 [Streptomyces sp. NPDC052016]|uniref:hypothetical protein n=1 Tax=unclassified Streptomyces TaxID=2593676 RepID=UPI00342063AD
MSAAADAYDRPPYRTPHAPARASGPGAWALDVLLPWRLARRVYGPFHTVRFSASDAVGPVGQLADPLIERLLLPRALLGLGVLFLIVRLFTGGGFAEPLGEAFSDSVLMLATGPVALLLACAPLVALARPGTRGTVARLCLRPLLTALLTAAFCGLFVAWALHGYDYEPDQAAWLVLVVLFGPWLTVFFGSVLYLIHRNAFSTGGHPLVRPLASVPLVWLTAIAHAVLIDAVEAYPGSHPTPSYYVALFAGPVAVTGTAVAEIALLRRRHGVGFRGPLPDWLPPQPHLSEIPAPLVERLRTDVARGLSHHWPCYVDRTGVVWAATPAVHTGQRVMWPYVPAFTERTRPAVWAEVEAAAGPLRPR